MIKESMVKECINPLCKKLFTPSRTDQMFCEDKCKSDFHNAIERNPDAVHNQIIKIIKANDKILSYCFNRSKEYAPTVSKEILIHHNYDFNLYTQKLNTKKGILRWAFNYGLIQDLTNFNNYYLTFRWDLSGKYVPTLDFEEDH